MPQTVEAAASVADETPWTDYVEALWHWRRFVALGTLGAWIVIATAAWLVPRRYECTATLSLPGAAIPVPLFGAPVTSRRADVAASSERVAPGASVRSEGEAGITSARYKRLERALADATLLEKGVEARLGRPGVPGVAGHLRLSPITNAPRRLPEPCAGEERITAVQLSYADHSAERSREVMLALGSVVRDALLTVTILDQIETESVAAGSLAVAAARERMRLEAEDEGLALEQAVAVRLAREYRGTGAARLLEIRSQMAQNASRTHQLAREGETATLHTAYLRRLDQAFRDEFARAASPFSADPAKTMRATLDATLAADKEGTWASRCLRADVEARAQMLTAVQSGVRFIQSPTASRRPRASLVGAAMAAGLLFVIGAALGGESWARRRASRHRAA